MEAERPQGLACRYIDDFFVSGMDYTPAEMYGMEYQKTSKDPFDVVYLGVRVQLRNGSLHSTLFDREEDYPFHIVRNPE